MVIQLSEITSPTSLVDAFADGSESSSIEKAINAQFFFYEEDSNKHSKWVSSFKIDGYHILLNGNIEIYLSCNLEKPLPILSVKFNLLMDYFTEQQNKINALLERMKADGISPSDLLGTERVQAGKPAKKRKVREAKYRFIDVNGEEKTWTGQGRTPKAIANALANGKTLDDFLI